jgi:hypothetical protein
MTAAGERLVRTCAAAALAIPLVAGSSGARAAGGGAPKLAVILVVDQMRADYVERFRHQWTGGLARLVDRGAWFRQAAYPYLNTVTCAGHATISTGNVPASHGIILNQWYDRGERRRITCTEDPASPGIGYGGPAATPGQSYKWLQVPTLADEMRAQLPQPPRIIAMSLKARSAIMLAGRRATSVTWLGAHGTWQTSAAYAQAPAPFISDFVTANRIDSDFGRSWRKMLPGTSYLYEETPVGAHPPAGWDTSWPHVLEGRGPKPDEVFYDLWQRSPFSDSYLERLATHAIDTQRLGRNPGIDYLGVSFSALDLVGHKFGPRSHEVQDVLANADAAIGRLLEHLDRTVGRDNYVVALSADHGLAPVPEYAGSLGLEAGRVDLKAAAAAVEAALTPGLGEGRHVEATVYTDMYLAPGVYDKLRENPKAMKAALDALRSVPGVWRAYESDELRNRPDTGDPVMRAAAQSHYPGRSGDLILVPKPYWITSADATTHGTGQYYDSRVPVILMGRGIRPGEYLQRTSPADIAPTLAFLMGITLAHPDGRVLVEAILTDAARTEGPQQAARGIPR